MMRSYLLCFFFLIPFLLFGQQSSVKRAQDNFEEAQQYVRQNFFDEAIKYLDLAVKADPKFVSAYLQLGDVYRKTKNYEKAKQNFKLALSNQVNGDVRVNFFLAESELLTGDYTNAKQNYQTFVNGYKGADTISLRKAKKSILDCDFATQAIKNPVVYQPKNMGFFINSEYRDYFPALTADLNTIIFSRVVDNNEDFYTSTKLKDEWQKAIPLSNKINTTEFNEGAQSLSPDGKYLFFTGCNRPDGLGRCDIFVSRKEGSKWGKPTNLGGVVNSTDWESQPSISPDGYTLYFVSNRPGGYGGNDIWKSTLDENGKWTAPVNLGPEINTTFDEVTPFIHADNKTLYFASDGWPGMGGKDIFMATKNANGTFSKPKNLGYPVNTFNEEVGLIVAADGKRALFSSDLNGGFGSIDIYYFDLPEQIKPNPITYVKGVIKDKDTKQPLEASILVINLDNDDVVYNDYTSAETGDFLTVMPIGSQYSFNADAEGYLFYSKYYELNKAEANKPFEIEILLEKIKVGSEVTLNNIFFETNKFELLPQSKIELEVLKELLNANPSVQIQIQGHTDNVGDAKANEKLAENRAKAVYSYLIKEGISRNRLSFKGFGETKPIADNNTEDGRKQNRRTNFIVTKIQI